MADDRPVMETMFLTKDEIVELTGRKQRSAQIAALNTLGIVHKVRPDGLPLVLRAYVEQLFGGRPTENKPQPKKHQEPNWAALQVAREGSPPKRNKRRGEKKAEGLHPIGSLQQIVGGNSGGISLENSPLHIATVR